MIISLLKKVNKYLPESLRLFLLPFYRKLLPDLKNILFIPELKCNYTCSYCIWNRFTPLSLKDSYRPYTDWIKVFEALEPSAVTITGGEPLLYKDIVPLIEDFPPKHLISCLVTNLSVNVDKLTSLKRKDFRIMASFHPSMTTKEEFASKLKELKKSGFSGLTVNFVAHPEHLKSMPSLKSFFEKETGAYFRIDTFKDPDQDYSQDELDLVNEYKRKGIIARDRTEGYDFSDFSSKRCKAASNYCLMIANGNVYSCMEGYYYTECPPYKNKYNRIDSFYVGNIFEFGFKLEDKDRFCHSPCAEICDIELAGVKRERAE
jgi:sulfatase maturation enzyme AslB (radical SAM superfamily)